ncbi:MAG: hypothetical protein AAFV07_20335, partial [Bacteroidota bacterium]
KAGCEVATENPFGAPRLFTLSPKRPTPHSVTFRAEVTDLGNKTVFDHGFIWPGRRESTTKGKDTISLGALSQNGPFEATVDWGLEKRGMFIPYLRYADTLVLGQRQEYVSEGSLNAIITGYSARQVPRGGQITVLGERMTRQLDKVSIRFGDRSALIVEANADSIRFRVSRDISPGSYGIQLTVFDTEVISTARFEVTD